VDGRKEHPLRDPYDRNACMSAESFLKAMKMRLSQQLTVQWQRPIDPGWFEIL